MKPTQIPLARRICMVMLLVAVPFTLAPTPANLTVPEYPGGSEKEGREGTSDIFFVEHKLTTPYDPVTGAPSDLGPQHSPLVVVKVIDKATPGLHKALTTGQQLSEITLDFYRIDPDTRAEAKYYVITLTNVRIVGIETFMPMSFLPENESYRHMEKVTFVYEEIEWNWLPDGYVETDTWR